MNFCPKCYGSVEDVPAGHRCKRCGMLYPVDKEAQQGDGGRGCPTARKQRRFWISDNDLQKLAEAVDEVRNIRMSVRRTHLRIHAVEIPAHDRPSDTL